MSDSKFDNLSNKLDEFRQLAIRLKLIKKEEMNLRVEICDVLLKGKQKGTHTFSIDGMNVKAVRQINMSLDAKMVDHHYEQFSDEEKAAVSFKPSLSVSKYNDIEGDSHTLDNCLTIKPATPTLTVILGE